MIKGKETLIKLKETSGATSDYFMYNSVKIEAKALERGIFLYDIGIKKFLGNGLMKKLESEEYSSIEELHEVLKPASAEGTGEWVDMAGLIVPKEKVLELAEKIEKGKVNTFTEMNAIFGEWHRNYYPWAWNRSYAMFQSALNINLATISKQQLFDFIEDWKNAVVSLDKMMFEDARKEFTLKAQTGFGMDGEDEIRNVDFEQVRGAFEKHPAVCDILEHIERKKKLASKISEKINSL
jgi:hypothetical protein